MKNIIKTLTAASLIFIFLFIPSFALAWDDCPKGKVNDPYPGDCARYIDTDGNGICDHSEPAPEDRVESSEETAETGVEGSAGNVEVDSAREDASSSSFLTIAAVIAVSLTAIIGYVSYRNLKVKKQ